MQLNPWWKQFLQWDSLEIKLEKEILVVLLLLLLGMILFHTTEWWSYFNALYFCIITITWVWYGDVVPVTTTGKILTMVFSMTALPLYVYTMTIFIEDRLKNTRKPKKKI